MGGGGGWEKQGRGATKMLLIEISGSRYRSMSYTDNRCWKIFIQVTQYVTQVLVTKREAEIKLDQQNFGERKEINKRKAMLLEGLDPDEVEEKLKEQREKR